MPTILLVRHSISTGEPGDTGLSPEGLHLARLATSRLADCGIRRIVSSPLRRRRETADAFAAAFALPVESDPRLRERDNWGDVALTEIHSDPDGYTHEQLAISLL